MEPVKVPQNLELKDVLVWGLEAADLASLAIGAVCGWCVYVVLPGPLALRLPLALPALAVGLAFAIGRVQERSLREWAWVVLAYLARPRRHLYGAEE